MLIDWSLHFKLFIPSGSFGISVKLILPKLAPLFLPLSTSEVQFLNLFYMASISDLSRYFSLDSVSSSSECLGKFLYSWCLVITLLNWTCCYSTSSVSPLKLTYYISLCATSTRFTHEEFSLSFWFCCASTFFLNFVVWWFIGVCFRFWAEDCCRVFVVWSGAT